MGLLSLLLLLAGTPSPTRIVAVGDVHGDLDATRAAFRLAGVVDEEGGWIGGSTILVQTGDQLDRGDDEPEILAWFHRLRSEALAAGGAFIPLNGNHELMNARLDFRYVTPEGFADYAPDPHVPRDSTLAAVPDSALGRAIAFRPGGPAARQLATRDVWCRVGDTVFVHGGILPEHVAYGLDRINAETRAWLRGEAPRPAVLSGSESPVWTRRYSDDVDASDCDVLARVLEALGAARMVVGHTVQDAGITAYCEDRVWCIDVGLAEAYGGPVQVLDIRGADVRVLSETRDTDAKAATERSR